MNDVSSEPLAYVSVVCLSLTSVCCVWAIAAHRFRETWPQWFGFALLATVSAMRVEAIIERGMWVSHEDFVLHLGLGVIAATCVPRLLRVSRRRRPYVVHREHDRAAAFLTTTRRR